jgi:hypothetical protein
MEPSEELGALLPGEFQLKVLGVLSNRDISENLSRGLRLGLRQKNSAAFRHPANLKGIPAGSRLKRGASNLLSRAGGTWFQERIGLRSNAAN